MSTFLVVVLLCAVSLARGHGHGSCGVGEALDNSAVRDVPHEQLQMDAMHSGSRKRARMPIRIAFDFTYFDTPASGNDCRSVGQVIRYPGNLVGCCV